MFLRLVLTSVFIMVSEGRHFNGGTIRWEPVNPYDNSSSVKITITQTYSWAYPVMTCANDVPISTSGRSGENVNLTCVADCSTDGGYSSAPINILTDCVSVSSGLGIMSSQRAKNVTLSTGAHFYLSYRGSAWIALNNPVQSGLSWSILAFIDLRRRPDGFINTPPVSSVVSPQYAVVNRTVQIPIPVSDENAGDTLRCRWSTYTPGNRRRRQYDRGESFHDESIASLYKPESAKDDWSHVRKKRRGNPCSSAGCSSTCNRRCPCSCSSCQGTSCSGPSCGTNPSCPIVATTLETPGTLPTTSVYPNRQAIDECGGTCYPNSVPAGTTLSNCTISFKGLIAGAWYAISIQVRSCEKFKLLRREKIRFT